MQNMTLYRKSIDAISAFMNGAARIPIMSKVFFLKKETKWLLTFQQGMKSCSKSQTSFFQEVICRNLPVSQELNLFLWHSPDPWKYDRRPKEQSEPLPGEECQKPRTILSHEGGKSNILLQKNNKKIGMVSIFKQIPWLPSWKAIVWATRCHESLHFR